MRSLLHLVAPVVVGLVSLSVCGAVAAQEEAEVQVPAKMSEQAWKAWADGDIEQAGKLAQSLVGSNKEASSGRHILFLKAFVIGKYEKALGIYKEINPEYPRYAELDKMVVNAYLHLGKYAEAEEFALSRKMDKILIDQLKQRKEMPLKATLRTITVVKFDESSKPLPPQMGIAFSEFMPGFEAELEGKKIIARMDTGGSFLVMSPGKAKEFGVKLTESGMGYHGTMSVKTSYGMAKSFKLGDAELENVPVVTVASLADQLNAVIFGTNILQQFLSTIDYPNRRLILSPKGNSDLREKHLAMLPKKRCEIHFYMGGDHYMFARGGMGELRNLSFFIDSGLVSLHPGGPKGLRQAAFRTSKDNLIAWGFSAGAVATGLVESMRALSLGPLEQKGLLLLAGSKKVVSQIEGVRIDGLLSHAWLKRYSWTIDFTEGKYIFSGDTEE